MNHENRHHSKEASVLAGRAAAEKAADRSRALFTGEKTRDKHAGHSPEAFLKKFWVSFILTVPVVLYSDLPRFFFGWEAPPFFGSRYLPPALGSLVFFYGGWAFTKGAVDELRKRLPGMMVLVSLAIWAAYLFSVLKTISGEKDALFWELTTLITVMLLGHFLEIKAVRAARSALKELSALLPDTAEIIRGDKTEKIPLADLLEGDTAMIRPGGKIPADGVVIDGRSEVNEAIITGESRPVLKSAGGKVIAGSINGDGALKAKILKIGERTFLAGIMRLVAEAQESKSKLQMLSDRTAFYLTLIAIFSGGLTLFAWILSGAEFGFALERFVAVLVIACPHALGLAVPLVASISTTMAARNGFLVRQRLALEAARSVDVALFDKTGTLTKGEYGVANVFPVAAGGKNDVLRIAASVDARSEHFISRAIVQKAKEEGIALTEAENFARISGRGVTGIIDGKEAYVGGEAILERAGVFLTEEIKMIAEKEKNNGKTVIFVIADGKISGLISLADVIRGESRAAIDELRRLGVKTAMITGDSPAVAKWVAEELGIEEYFAGVLPEQKSEKVKLLQSRGLKTAMVGDGINDAPALARADVGIAIGAGTNVAIESAGIILARNDPRDVAKIIKLSRRAYSKMIQNLFWATIYNFAALPAAAGAFVSYGIVLQPAASAVLMSLSVVIVAVNALTLKTFERKLKTSR